MNSFFTGEPQKTYIYLHDKEKKFGFQHCKPLQNRTSLPCLQVIKKAGPGGFKTKQNNK